MGERTDQSALAVHAEVPSSPHDWSADVGEEDRVVSSNLVDRLRDELGVERVRLWSLIASSSSPSRALDSAFASAPSDGRQSSAFIGNERRHGVFHRANQWYVNPDPRPMCSPRRSTWRTVASCG